MRPGSLALVGTSAYVLFLLATLPASVVANRLPATSAARIEMADVEGTIWSGSARIDVMPASAPPIRIERLAWRFLPSRLASGKLAYEARFAAAGMRGSMEAGRRLGGWYASAVEARGDAQALEAFVPLASAWRPAGEISLAVPGLELDKEGARGEASAEWRKASVALSDVRPLGSYRAQWKGEGKGSVELTTLEGPLRVTGVGSLSPQGRLSFAGEARADPAHAKALEPLLDLIGPRRPDGARSIAFR